MQNTSENLIFTLKKLLINLCYNLEIFISKFENFDEEANEILRNRNQSEEFCIINKKNYGIFYFIESFTIK